MYDMYDTATVTIKQPDTLDPGDISDLLDIDPIHARKLADEFKLILGDDLDGDVHKLLGRASSALDIVMNAVRPMIKAGASLHWLVSFEKRPIAEEWSQAPFQTETNLRATYRRNANIGIRLGEPSRIDGAYLHLIDLDIRDATQAPDAWAKVLEMWPAARGYPTVISGSGGESRHIYFLSKSPFPKKKLAKSAGHSMVWDKRLERDVKKYDWEIDLLGTGSQAVIPPSIHPDTNLPYLWQAPLDLDLPAAMVAAPALMASWGVAAVASADEADEDDLFAIVRAEPMDLSDDDVDGVVADLPSSWVEDRDQWLTVGAALHHQFEGGSDGFERWNEWAKQSAKFNARDSARVWKSFGGAKNPVRTATLIQAANNNRLSDDLDFELEDDFEAAPMTAALPAPTSKYDLSNLLGPEPRVGPELVIAQKANPVEEYDPDWTQRLHRNEKGELKSTLPNVALIIDNEPRTRDLLAYNEFEQDWVILAKPKQVKRSRESGHNPINLVGRLWQARDSVNGDHWTDSHDTALRAMIESKTQLKGYGIKVSDRDMRGGVDLSASRRAFHPVKEAITRPVWDNECRAETMFIDYLGCEDNAYYRQAALMTLVGAVARIFQPGHKFDFVPILEGAQGKGKSTFIKILGLDWSSELVGDISDPKQMVEGMQGSWIIEIGELSAMHRSEVNDLKAFVSRTADKVRLAFAKRGDKFLRQCIFMGSTNDREYLRDVTGGRRFWPIVCNLPGNIDTDRFRDNMMQIWAETVVIYHRMVAENPGRELPLFMTEEAADLALEMQESRRVESAEEMLAGQITAWLEEPIDPDSRFDDLDPSTPKQYRQETCVAQVWQEVLGKEGSPTGIEASRIGRAMTIIGWPRSPGVVAGRSVNKKFGPCRVYTRPTT
jgi:predicted P-loop ATPase